MLRRTMRTRILAVVLIAGSCGLIAPAGATAEEEPAALPPTFRWNASRRNLMIRRGTTDADIPAIPDNVDSIMVHPDINVSSGAWSRLGELHQLRSIVLRGQTNADAMLEALARLDRLEILSVYGHATAEGMAHVARMRNLKLLKLHESAEAVTPETLAALGDLTELGRLELSRSDVGDDDLAALPEFPKLYSLSLPYNPLGDAGLRALSRFPKLRMLNLYDTRVGDAGMRQVGALHELRELHVGATNVTDAGLRELYDLDHLLHFVFIQTKINHEPVRQLIRQTNRILHTTPKVDVRYSDSPMRISPAPQTQKCAPGRR